MPNNNKLIGTVGFISVGFGAVTILIASIIMYSIDPFNFFTHWISNLGIAGCGANYIFNIGMTISGILFLIFLVMAATFVWAKGETLIGHIRNVLVVVALGFSTVAVIGLLMVASFPMYVWNLPIHVLGASLLFFCFLIFAIVFTISLIINGKWTIWNILTMVFIILMFVAFTTSRVVEGVSQADWGNYGVPLWARFFEWMYMFAILTYLFYLSYFIYTYNSSNPLKIKI